MGVSRKFSFVVEESALEVTDRPRRFLEAFAAVLEHSSYALPLHVYSRLNIHCSVCSAACPLYQETRLSGDIPCRRSELLLQVYRRYFTSRGALKARLTGGGFCLTDAYLNEMAEAFYRCTACRRCQLTCPMGIDHGLITHLARWLLAEIQLVPKALRVAVREQLEGVGNTSAIPLPALKDTCEFLEEEFEDIYNVSVPFPIDQEEAEFIFFPAVSDFLLEADTLMGNAAVLALTGARWTIGSGNYDGINYGLFYSDRMMEQIARRVVQEVRRLGAKKILVGECGHATRSAWFIPTFCGSDAPEVVNCLQYACQQLRSGRLPLTDQLIRERVTYHDPCNLARNRKIIDEPRYILRTISEDYVEMSPAGDSNYCCGGGGGTVSIDEIRGFRTGLMGKAKADQIRRTEAKYVVAPCANCKKQLREVCQDHGLDEVEVVGLHDLLLRVLDFSSLRSNVPDSKSSVEQDSSPLSNSHTG